jgi:paired small multidrug resistance pump
MQIQMYDVIGMLGVFGILLAYFLLQVRKLKADGFLYSLLNLIGAGCVLYSLFFKWNLFAVIIETIWVIISAYGIYKRFTTKK